MAKKKERDVICGVHAVLAALERGPGRVRRLFIASGRKGRPAEMARELTEKAGIPVVEFASTALEEMAQTPQHQGLVAEVHPIPILTLEAFLEAQPAGRPPILLLDGIQDPRNLGAILRTAAALGAGGAVWPKDSAVDLTPSVVKAAAGGVETLPLARVTNMARAVSAVKKAGYWAVAGDPEGEAVLGDTQLPWPTALVLGGEGKGVRRLVRKNCDMGVRIPVSGGIVMSLNVSVAAGILLHEIISRAGGSKPRKTRDSEYAKA
ncbi:MAG: 23S rRNA (guanosine(2251)-2'-O)-methyltransferase RlmB [Nitrospinota bacterium]